MEKNTADPESVEAGLTRAQRRAVVSMSEEDLSNTDFRGLQELGVIKFAGWRTLLTDPLGLAVRAALQAKETK